MITQNERVIENYEELQADETGTAAFIRGDLCIRCGMCIKACPENVVYYRRFASLKETLGTK